MRLFISISFNPKTKDNILRVQRNLKRMGNGRFTTPDNLHLTLAFLGEVEEKRVDELKDVMNSINIPEMRLEFSRIGCFRSESELWWIGIRENEELFNLQKTLVDKLKANGFKVDEKKFRPHITLAREMHIGQANLRFDKFTAKADAISLMLSHRPDGKLVYTELYRKSNII